MGRTLPRVLVIGGGELGSAVSHRLARSGMEVFVADLEKPKCIRRGVCFAMACYDGSKEVEGITAEKVDSTDEALKVVKKGNIPVLVGDFKRLAVDIAPHVIVDARMFKRGQDISKNLAGLVIGLGPGFVAPRDVHAVIETNRGHNLGRVIYEGAAEPDTGVPGEVQGFTTERVIRAAASGVFASKVGLGRIVQKGEIVGTIDGRLPVEAPIDGLLRGLVADGVWVKHAQKIGDVDPRGAKIDPNAISDKGRAVAGGVLEAVMHWWTEGKHAAI